MKKALFLLTVCLLPCVNALFAQELKYFGAPFITQYLPKEYDGSAQNWDIIQDKRGVIYVGNTDGLLEFDGVNWRKYEVKNKSVVRSLDIDESNGKIWTGASEEFGYFEPDSLGDLAYHSLSEKLPDSIQNFKDIWKTVAVPSGIYFFSATKFFRWYKGELTVTNVSSVSFMVDKIFNQLYTWNNKKGLCFLKDTTLTQLLNDEDLLKFGGGYRSICEYKENKILIATTNNGFFVYDIETKELSQPKLDPKIVEYSTKNTGAYSLCRINDDAYALGTFKGGLLVFNAKFELTDVVNTQRGLQSNSIYSLFFDQYENLWATLQNGIARIDINNPLRSFGEKQNMNAYGLDAIDFENKKYVATMNGCLVLDKHSLKMTDDNHGFTYIPNINNCWDLHIYKDKLLVAGSFGVSQILNDKNKSLFVNPNSRTTAFSMHTSKKFPNHLFVSYQDDFVAIELAEQANSDYLEVKKTTFFPNIVGSVRSITTDKNDDLWLGMQAGGAIFIHFTDENDISAYQMSFFNEKNNLPSKKTVLAVNIDNQMSFLTSKGIYSQVKNDKTPLIRFEHNKFWGDYINHDSTSYEHLSQIKENIFAVSNEFGDVSAFLEKKKDTVLINRAPFAKVNGISDLVLDENKRNLNVCTSSSFYIYDLNKDSIRTDKVYNTLIRKVSIAQDSLIFKGSFYSKNGTDFDFAHTQSKEQIPVLDYSNNSIKIHFSAAFYDASKEVEYSYLLEGFNDKWTHWSKESNAVFTNIPEGDYIFQVKAKNIYSVESSIATYQFTVLAPWYRTIYAFILYFILLAGFIWGIVKLNSRRLIKEKEKLENTVIERTAELFQQKEEILVQAESLLEANDNLEKAYTNVQLLSEIGQEITSKLSVELIIDTVYKNVNQLMEAEVFAIGIVQKGKGRMEFYGAKENGQALPYYYDELTNNNKLSIYCYKNFETILFKDAELEITKYLPQKPNITVGEETNSLIYLPLGTPENTIGVITVQSFNKNVYTNYHLNILRNIGIYTSIALGNTKSYSQIKKQHTEIKSSVNYASTIQNAILPSRKQLDALFDNFIIYRPKDIVSGDFYWLSEVGNNIFIAVVDCTGHGVPGAFMSMIGSRLLSEIVNEREIKETDSILEALNTGIRKVLHQDQTDNTDGMDICLCKIEKNDIGAEVSFTGAKSPLFIYQNDKSDLLRIRGDKKTIGGNHFENLSFTQTKLSLKKGDTIYLTSDGFVDQNNQERKKFTTVGLMNLLKEIHSDSILEQGKRLESELDNWQGLEKQRDDITLIGLKI